MAIQQINNALLYGLAADTKPTVYANNTLLFIQDTGDIYRWNLGTTTWVLLLGAAKSETLSNKIMEYTQIAPTAAGGFESVFRASISSSTDGLTIDNGYSTANLFAPIIRATLTSAGATSGQIPLYFQGICSVANDAGTAPCIAFGGQRTGAVALTTRPILSIMNQFNDVITVYPTYADFHNLYLKNISEVAQSPLQKRWGSYQPAQGTTATTVGQSDGILATTATATGPGTNTNTFDTTEGVLANLITTTTTNQNAGLVSSTAGVGIGRRLFGMRARMRSKVDAVASSVSRLYFGFTSATALPTSDTPLATTDHGVIVGYKSTDTNWTIYHNDGATSVTADAVTGPIAKDTAFHTIEINWAASGNINVIFDGVSQTISTDLPATTANLYFNAVVQNATAAIRTHSIKGIWLEADK